MDELTANAAGILCLTSGKARTVINIGGQGVNKYSIIKGLNNAVARRIANLAGNNALEEDVYIDGGPALNTGLVEALEDELLCDINVVESPQFTVAFGALFI